MDTEFIQTKIKGYPAKKYYKLIKENIDAFINYYQKGGV